jgi:hypothetical protein
LVQTWKSNSNTPAAITFLLLLLALDLVFIFVHFLLLTDAFDNGLFSLERDRGYPELYQYIKVFSIVILLYFLFTKTKVIGYSVWCLLFLYLLLDDAFSIHESFGGFIATNLALAPAIGLRAQDFGELAVSLIAATVFLIPLALFYARGLGAFKEVTRQLLWLLVALAFFGIFVDMLHVAINMGWKVRFLLGVVEDGGEMVVMSLMAWYVFLIYYRDGHASSSSRYVT